MNGLRSVAIDTSVLHKYTRVMRNADRGTLLSARALAYFFNTPAGAVSSQQEERLWPGDLSASGNALQPGERRSTLLESRGQMR
jgi:hypothetical protein